MKGTSQDVLRIDVVTLFAEIFSSPLGEDSSICGRAISQGDIQVGFVDLRSFGIGRHRQVDDSPYGGGPGMLLKAEPLLAAIESVRTADSCVILLTPQGEPLVQSTVQEMSTAKHLILICGRYEGVDERIRSYVDREISLGDFVLTGGELGALCVIDAVARLQPGVLGNQESTKWESFSHGLLEYPQYTRPSVFRGVAVPDVLQSGNHQEIAKWRHEQALCRTRERRADLSAQIPHSLCTKESSI